MLDCKLEGALSPNFTPYNSCLLTLQYRSMHVGSCHWWSAKWRNRQPTWVTSGLLDENVEYVSLWVAVRHDSQLWSIHKHSTQAIVLKLLMLLFNQGLKDMLGILCVCSWGVWFHLCRHEWQQDRPVEEPEPVAKWQPFFHTKHGKQEVETDPVFLQQVVLLVSIPHGLPLSCSH